MDKSVSPQPHVAIEHVTKRFSNFLALNDVSLDIRKGEFICFLGPSGCGKTTLLRAIAGLDIQSEGRIFMNGKDVSGLPPSQRDFGIVFQSYALFPNLTVAHNVAYGLQGRGMPRADIAKRVATLLALVGLPDQGGKHPAQLSGGQQQRVALARALATEPSLILLDEPLSALDAKVRNHLRKEMKDLQRNLGVTTIMVTHDQQEALTMADRIVVMNKGRIEQIGTPEGIYARPASAFVADFVGEMNFMPGEVIGDNQIRIGKASFQADTSAIKRREVVAAIRPEDIIIQDVTASQPNRVQATLLESEFLGSFLRARMTGGDLADTTLRADIAMNLVRNLGVSQGQQLPIVLPADRLRVYPLEA
ncbi:putative 2-aminoethylphosphonate ABC transporter ATP-binding protein [Bradyrhizobium prioriisuperbiae]|uniref:putative 2-aminoethylphosphonate ABC transporter ATP-binding protein n=1 Tax=Bradyrhizobium prioriisuperbiae TaxID=2854389 RepID=UPI0028EFF652|nr:putative 2-aminoethylphosphonate ABC transporter ATP-binding protein [Bradyrhizobium prioritasuperba]